jgi:hypothetical protein
MAHHIRPDDDQRVQAAKRAGGLVFAVFPPDTIFVRSWRHFCTDFAAACTNQ